jgi:rubrerythrin
MKNKSNNTVKDDLSERLQACLKMETQCADVYTTLVTLFPRNLFPEARDLFETLAEWEKSHADIIAVSIGFNKIDEIPDIFVPSELSLIKNTLDIAQDIKASIQSQRVTLKVALYMVLKMEESLAESYLQDVMTQKIDLEIIKYLRRFYKDEKSHAEMIKELILKKGY